MDPLQSSAMVVFGEALWDQFPDGPRLGGAPANFAAHCARLGEAVFLVSAVGRDPLGEGALAGLRALKVDTRHVASLSDLPTGVVEVLERPGTGPVYRIASPAAWDAIDWSPELESQVRNAALVYFGTLGQRDARSRGTIRRALAMASEVGIPRLLDVNLRAPWYDATRIRESIGACSLLKLSDDELPEVLRACGLLCAAAPGEAIQCLREQCELDLVILTRGPMGAVVATPDGLVEQAGIPVEVVDTVGAGDAFCARLAVGLVRKEPLAASVAAACALAARVCAQRGAVLPI